MEDSSSPSKVSVSNKDLLQLERSASVLEKRLQVCSNVEDLSKRGPPLITSMPESSVLGRIRSFLPALDQANRKLFSDIEERGTEHFNIESVSDAEERYVEMDLALGVAELNTPQALAAAELAANGQVLRVDDAVGSFGHCSDSESDEEDTISRKNISELLGSRRTAKECKQTSGCDHECCNNDKSQIKRKKIELL